MSDTSARATFIMEQHLGHLTYYRNLRGQIDSDDRLTATWLELDYGGTHAVNSGLLSALPSRLRGPIVARKQAVECLRSSLPEIAFFNTQVPAALTQPHPRRTPYILATDITPKQYDRMAEHYDHSKDRFPPVAMAKHAVNLRVFRGARKVVCWSSWCAESVATEYGVPEDRIEVIAPGVDLDVWRPQLNPKALDDSKPKILFVGGDLHRKGGIPLIDAFMQLPEKSAELHLVTKSTYRNDAPNIFFHRDMTPNSPELIALFQASDVFVLPSSAEAFGIAATEATACGLPIVASRSGGLADIVVDGKTGFTVASIDSRSLMEPLSRLVEDASLRQTMGAAGRARAEQLFDAATNGMRIADLLVDAR